VKQSEDVTFSSQVKVLSLRVTNPYLHTKVIDILAVPKSSEEILLFDLPEVEGTNPDTMNDPKLMKQNVRRPSYYEDSIWTDKASGFLITALETIVF